MKEQLDYPFFVRPLSKDEGGGYLIEFPDLPGCMSDGETPEEAIENGRDALKGVLALKRELGHTIPEPGAGAASGQWRQRVPKSLHARLIEQAEYEGVSLNTLVTTFIAQGLGSAQRSIATVTRPVAVKKRPPAGNPRTKRAAATATRKRTGKTRPKAH